MDFLVRLTAMFALLVATVAAVPAQADYQGADGYGTAPTNQLDVSHDGYVREGHVGETDDPATYVVIEAESGTSEQVDGETVIVVQEPEPIAATEAAPPPLPTVVVEQPVALCPEGIWVDGYWSYGDGQYLWVDGHCVVERVNYVFVQPRWDYYASVWWFVPGYYRPCSVYVGFGYYRPWHWYPPYHHPYYRRGHPAPVHRAVPRRTTAVRATSVSRTPSRGVLGRPGYTSGRTSTVERRPPTTPVRTSTVGRADRMPTRTGTVSRVPTRTSTVTRAPAVTRTSTVTRAPAVTRTGAIMRTPTITRTGAVTRPPSNHRSATVTRPPASRASTGTVGRPPSAPSSSGSVSRASTGSSRTSSVRRPSASPSRGGSSRGSSVGRASASPSRARGFGRPSFGASRPSVGRAGGFGRPSSGGFGGSRSIPTARGR